MAVKIEGRDRVFASRYFDIALWNYKQAMQHIRDLKNSNDSRGWFEIDETIARETTVVTVFSAMCVEAYLNDYLAIRKGDIEYNTSKLERKPVKCKLEEVALICTGSKCVDDQLSEHIEQLFNRRNGMVHAKSSDVSYMSDADENEEREILSHEEIRISVYKEIVERNEIRQQEAEMALNSVILLYRYMRQYEKKWKPEWVMLGIDALPEPPAWKKEILCQIMDET